MPFLQKETDQNNNHKRHDTIITLVYKYTITFLCSFAKSIYYIMMMMMLDSFDAVSRRSDRGVYTLSLLILSFDGPPLVLFGSRAIDVPRVVSRRGFDRSQFHRSLLPEDSGFAFERRRGYGGEKTG